MTIVYRISDISNPERIRRFFHDSRLSDVIMKGDLVAVKLHMGETINQSFIKPVFVREIINAIKDKGGKPFLTDSTTLYLRGRFNAIDYLETARKNGFSFNTTGVPVIIADGLIGENGIEVKSKGKIIKKTEISQAIYEADSLIVLTHCTGHISTGYAGAIKNIGMGCVTKNGKRAVHRFSMPIVNDEICTRCRTCEKSCPYNVITVKEKVVIDPRWCVGCALCIRVCPSGAMHREKKWIEKYLQALVETTASVIKKFNGKIAFMNFLTDITADCDCAPQRKPVVPDIGVLASMNIVGIEQASYDLIKKKARKDILGEITGINGQKQIAMAEKIGMGSRRYKIKKFKF